MKPDVVVDIGNTRIKWGRCSEDTVTAVVGLSPDDPVAWEEQARSWGLTAPMNWVISGVHPARSERLVEWLRQRRDIWHTIDSARQLRLRVLVDYPEKVGMDRLLNAVAANAHRRPDSPAVIIDAGSAVTVDLVDANGAFRGGAIMPGLRLMAQALHDHTALLPLIDLPRSIPPLPGTSTPDAMAAGVIWVWAGGIRALVNEYAVQWQNPDDFITGGDGPLLTQTHFGGISWPEMTLEGIRLTAEALP